MRIRRVRPRARCESGRAQATVRLGTHTTVRAQPESTMWHGLFPMAFAMWHGLFPMAAGIELVARAAPQLQALRLPGCSRLGDDSARAIGLYLKHLEVVDLQASLTSLASAGRPSGKQ